MNGHPPCSQVVNPEHTADNISSHVIENQHFPNRIAILVEYRSCVSESGRIVGVIFVGRRILVQVEDLLNRRCDRLSVLSYEQRRFDRKPTDLAVPERH